MFYLSIFLLLLALANLLILLAQQLQRARSFAQTVSLEQKILKNKVDQIIASATADSNEQESAWSGWRKFRIDGIVDENVSIKSFYLRPHDGKKLPAYLPGQHLTFRLKVPGHSKPVVRCYSLSDSCDKGFYRISVKKQLAPRQSPEVSNGIASSYLHDTLEIGDVVDVRAPAGKFYLDQTEKSAIVMIAGGIGITPSLAMLNALATERSTRPILLLYAVQNTQDQIMHDQLITISETLPQLRIHRFFNEASTETLSSRDHIGYIDMAALQSLNTPWDADFYVCGPPPMMQAIVPGLENQGVDKSRIHFESFGPASVSKRQAVNSEEAAPSEKHTITFTMSDTELEWTESQGSILEAAESIGVDIDSGCRAGSCGSCLTAIAEGEVTYIDEPGTDIERGSCLACIAIPAGNLKLNA